MKIGFIGLGNMGSAIAKAVARLGQHELLLSNHNEEKVRQVQKSCEGTLLSNAKIVSQADLIFLGVKPNLLFSVLEDLSEAIVKRRDIIWVSMAAGVTLDQLSAYLPSDKLIRMMPNTPVEIGQGMTTFATTDPELARLFQSLMEKSGKVQEVDESLIDTATAIAGCGPAFVYEMIDAMTQAGVQNGLNAMTARHLAAQTLLGASKMVLKSDKHPAQLRDEVTSPGGATIAGLVAMTQSGLQSAIIQGINQALLRTKELGEE